MTRSFGPGAWLAYHETTACGPRLPEEDLQHKAADRFVVPHGRYLHVYFVSHRLSQVQRGRCFIHV